MQEAPCNLNTVLIPYVQVLLLKWYFGQVTVGREVKPSGPPRDMTFSDQFRSPLLLAHGLSMAHVHTHKCDFMPA